MPDKVAQGEKILRELTDRYEITCIQGPIRDWKTEAMDEDFKRLTMNKTKHLIDLAYEYNVEKILFFSTYDQLVNMPSYDDMWLENNVAFWKEAAKYAKAKNITFLYCNVWDCKPELMRKLFKRVNAENFKFGFDIGHAFYAGKMSLEMWVDSLKDYLDYVCVHDNNGDMDEHLQLGKGKINLEKIISYIKNLKSDLMYCLQFFVKDGYESSVEILENYLA